MRRIFTAIGMFGVAACGAFGTTPTSSDRTPDAAVDGGSMEDDANADVLDTGAQDAAALEASVPEAGPSACTPACTDGKACDRGVCVSTSCTVNQTPVIVPLTQIAPESDNDIKFIGGSPFAAVTEVTPDNDTTYLYGTSTGLTIVLFDHAPVLQMPPGTTKLGKIVIKMVARRTFAEAVTVHMGFWRALGDRKTNEQSLTTSFVEYLKDHLKNPFDDSAWSLPDFNAMKMELALDHKGTPGSTIRLTHARLEACFE